MEIVNVDPLFQQRMGTTYPPHQDNDGLLEPFAYRFYKDHSEEFDVPYKYLPIMWTSWHCNHDYGKKKDELQTYYNKLRSQDPNSTFFTVIQYDDGPLIETPGLVKFTGANFDGIQTPLLVSDHPIVQKPIRFLASFVGRTGTHPIRKKMVEALRNESGYFISEHMGLDGFRDVMQSSLFSLCPRGYGCTSFRLWESFQMGKVPVVIHEKGKAWLPFSEYVDWSSISIVVDDEHLTDIPDLLAKASNPDNYDNYLRNIKTIREAFFTGEGVCRTIIRILTDMKR